MGSMITLAVEKMEIDWGKNNYYNNHSALFLPQDIKKIPYYYVDTDTEMPIVEYKEGYSRKLSSVKNRLDLLGYSSDNIRQLYSIWCKQAGELGCKKTLTFEDFYCVVSKIAIPKADTVAIAVEHGGYGYDFGEYFSKCVLEDPEIRKAFYGTVGQIEQQHRNSISEFFENLDPYITLRVLAENPDNHDLELQWRFADVIENGWIKREEIVQALPQSKRILIVTEGSSDSFVIKKTIDYLYTDIADFFDFVDMEENYPFTGVGSLYNFCLGLARIGIQNKIIVIFDNDTAGNEKHLQSLQIKTPPDFIICKLPDYHDFEKFSTMGPSGETTENINGKAVSIECFLDFKSVSKTPYIRWTSYNNKMQQYQGELAEKEKYIKTFIKSNLINGTYNSHKLKYLVDYLTSSWIKR